MTTEEKAVAAIDAAVQFVAAQTGGPARILAVHHRRPDGSCSGCSTSHTRWPCVAAAIATAALTEGVPHAR